MKSSGFVVVSGLRGEGLWLVELRGSAVWGGSACGADELGRVWGVWLSGASFVGVVLPGAAAPARVAWLAAAAGCEEVLA